MSNKYTSTNLDNYENYTELQIYSKLDDWSIIISQLCHEKSIDPEILSTFDDRCINLYEKRQQIVYKLLEYSHVPFKFCQTSSLVDIINASSVDDLDKICFSPEDINVKLGNFIKSHLTSNPMLKIIEEIVKENKINSSHDLDFIYCLEAKTSQEQQIIDDWRRTGISKNLIIAVDVIPNLLLKYSIENDSLYRKGLLDKVDNLSSSLNQYIAIFIKNKKLTVHKRNLINKILECDNDIEIFSKLYSIEQIIFDKYESRLLTNLIKIIESLEKNNDTIGIKKWLTDEFTKRDIFNFESHYLNIILSHPLSELDRNCSCADILGDGQFYFKYGKTEFVKKILVKYDILPE